MRTTKERWAPEAPGEHILVLNYATLGLVDEILRLPSPAIALTAVALLYGPEVELPESLLAQVGRGVSGSVAALLREASPLATLLPARVGPATWRAVTGDSRDARALARQRYRELQAYFLTSGRILAEGADSLVRDTYGTRGRWGWNEAARRILARVVLLNRAALTLLVARPRGQRPASFQILTGLPDRLPDHALALLAEALPPIALPDFWQLAACLTSSAPVLDGEESIERYQSLFAEMLSLAGRQEEVRA